MDKNKWYENRWLRMQSCCMTLPIPCLMDSDISEEKYERESEYISRIITSLLPKRRKYSLLGAGYESCNSRTFGLKIAEYFTSKGFPPSYQYSKDETLWVADCIPKHGCLIMVCACRPECSEVYGRQLYLRRYEFPGKPGVYLSITLPISHLSPSNDITTEQLYRYIKLTTMSMEKAFIHLRQENKMRT